MMKCKIINVVLSLVVMTMLSSCCVLFPNSRKSTVTVKVSPSNAVIKKSNGTYLGTGSCKLDFDCYDDMYDYYTISISAPDYKTRTERVKNYRFDYTENYSLTKLKHYKVKLSVTPSNASIYLNDAVVGVGSYIFDFTEEDSNGSYYEVYIEAPNCYPETVKIYKNDNEKQVVLVRKPIKTIVTVPGDAYISINNEQVAQGKYDVSFENTNKVLITLSCVGYETATYTLLKSDPNQTITYEMDIDEAYENSEGGESASQYANRWVPIKVRSNLSEEEAWLRMISIVRENFDQLEKTDKSSGWIKTFPAITPYKASDVRTVMEIVPDFSTGEKKYKVRLTFEKRKKGSGEEGWVEYNRLMKKYKDVIPNMINSIGGGM